MKKILIILISAIAISCSNESINEANLAETSNLKFLSQKLKNGVMNFKDVDEFIKTYELANNLTPLELEKFIELKKMNFTEIGSFTDLYESIDIETDEEYVFESNILAINMNTRLLFCRENSIKIDNEIYYLDSDGNIKSSNEDNKTLIVISNGNSSDLNRNTVTYQKNWVSPNLNGRRVIFAIYNQRLTYDQQLHNQINIAFNKQYRSCSVWRCTGKDEGNQNATATTYLDISSNNVLLTDGINNLNWVNFTEAHFHRTLVNSYYSTGTIVVSGSVWFHTPAIGQEYYVFNNIHFDYNPN